MSLCWIAALAVVYAPGLLYGQEETKNESALIVVTKRDEGDFASIRAAVAFSEPGDIIEIRDNAAYPEDLVLPPERMVRAAAGCRPIIQGNIVMGDRSVLQGVTVEPLEYEIWGLLRCNRLRHGCVVRNCRISGKRAPGLRGARKGEKPTLITVWESSGVQLLQNVLSDGNVGIWIERYSRQEQSQPIVLQGNRIQHRSSPLRIDNPGGRLRVQQIEEGAPVAPPAWLKSFVPGKRKDFRALRARYAWLQGKFDSLPPTGGTVELPAGTYELFVGAVLASRKNITLRGAGKDRTVIKMLKPGYVLSAKHSEGIVVEDLSVQHVDPPARTFYFYNSKNCRIANVSTGGAYLDCCDDFVFENGRFKGSMWWTHCRRIRFVDNSLSHSGGNHIIDLNAGNSDCLIERNRFEDGYAIHVYSGSTRNVVRANTFYRMRGAINIMLASFNTVEGNIIRDTYSRPAILIDSKDISCSAGNVIRRNIIFAGRTDGIKHSVKKPSPGHPRVLKALEQPNRVEGNVIYGNKGVGIEWSEASRYGYDRPVVRHNIVVRNAGRGIVGASVNASYNDVWKNRGGDYQGCEPGPGAISADPRFVDPAGGDFHLMSAAGRWDPKQKRWVKDNCTSPCIDAGDPAAGCGDEPAPNGGRLNLGAYGGTGEASKSTGR